MTGSALYLDFDGVLHDENVYFHPRRGIYIKTPGRTLFEWMPILEGLLLPHPEVSIILSTSWVRVFSFDFAKNQLSQALQERVIGATYHRREMRKAWFDSLPRGVQIEKDVYRRAPKAWFAVDDDAVGWPAWCRNNLILASGAHGISDSSVQDKIRTMLESF